MKRTSYKNLTFPLWPTAVKEREGFGGWRESFKEGGVRIDHIPRVCFYRNNNVLDIALKLLLFNPNHGVRINSPDRRPKDEDVHGPWHLAGQQVQSQASRPPPPHRLLSSGQEVLGLGQYDST